MSERQRDEDDEDLNQLAARIVEQATAERPDPGADEEAEDPEA